MYLLVARADADASAELVDPDNFRQLHVDLGDVGDVGAAAALSAQGFGTLEGDHAWLDVEALRRAGRDSPEWQTGFDAMLQYAQGQGWTDEGRTRVRAHVVRS